MSNQDKVIGVSLVRVAGDSRSPGIKSGTQKRPPVSEENPRNSKNPIGQEFRTVVGRLHSGSGMMLRTMILLVVSGIAMNAMAWNSGLTLLHQDDFRDGLEQWVVEQQPGGRTWTEHGTMIIEDTGGCSVWFRQKMAAPVVITYKIKASSRARVSDINCFWMASEPGYPDDHFRVNHSRDGSFASYDLLQTYYVGMGGNSNSTTRFRRYEGGGKRPLLDEHDLQDADSLITPDQEYEIMLVAADGVASFYRNGKLMLQWKDPEPLEEGWFAFRTVWSRLEIRDFRVWKPRE
jgi:hypothetical protein